MKDLSKLDVNKNSKQKSTSGEKTQNASAKAGADKRKKLIIIAVVVLMSIAVGSKIVQKYIKKHKTTEEQTTQLVNKDATKDSAKDLDIIGNEIDNTDVKGESTTPKVKKEAKKSNEMTFTFYDNLKKETVKVDAQPASERAKYKYTYIYQVASFRNMNEANYYVAKMKEVGLTPQFKPVGTWIRMSIGPYSSKRAIAPDIIKLQRIGLNGGFAREISKTKIDPKENTTDNSKDTEK